MEEIFAEIGFGNDTFLSTEFENKDTGKEYRRNGFFRPKKINEYYLRIWINKKVYILSTKEGFKTKHKDRKEIKFLFGISDYSTK